MTSLGVWNCARRRSRLVASLAFCLVLIGCGGSPSSQLTGRVTNNGEPVEGAEMQFASTTNPEVLFRGSTSADGSYQLDYRGLDGMPPGPYKVTIRRYSLPDGKPLPQGEEADGFETDGKVVVTTVTFDQEVAEGSNDVDFELTKGTKPGA